MDSNRESLYLVATGKIERPSIEVSVNGKALRFDGKAAQIFALGMLSGLAGAGDFTLNVSASFDEEGDKNANAS